MNIDPKDYQHDGWRYIPPERIKYILEHCPSRWGDNGQFQVFWGFDGWFSGKWYYLCRTDLIDNIATGISFTTDKDFYKDPLGYYFAKCSHYGARRNDESIAVIDSLTDG